MRVGGTFSQPTIGIDAEALVLGGVQDTLRDVLRGLSDDDSDADANADPDNAQAEETTPEDAALGLLDTIFGQPRDEEESETPDE